MESSKASGAASGAGSASATASASSTALRRSKRDATTRVVAVKSEESAAPAASQRRSQRSAKSTYATPSVATSASTPATKDKRPSRPQRSSVSTIKEESIKSASVPPPISTSAETSAKHRRPTRRQSRQVDAAPTPTAANGGTRSAAQARRLFLGQYSARCATALCEVILQQMKTQACDPRVLESEVSPAGIKWTDVATQMKKLHQVVMKPRECQVLWKFLAYGHEAVEGTDLLDGSDTEDYEITSHVLNERRRHQAIEIKREETVVVLEEATNEGEQTEDATSNSKRTDEQEQSLASDPQRATEGESVEQPTPNSTEQVIQKPLVQEVAPEGTSEENHPLVRLHPIYTQPSGVPDGWESLPPQPSLPLVYVAEKFLKRKPAVPVGAPTPVHPGATVTASANANSTPNQAAPGLNAHQIAAAAGVMLSEEQPKPKAKRKRKSDAGADTSKKQPKPLTSSSTPNAMKAPYVPSNAPPPNPTPPRNPVEFFYQIYKENPRVVVFDAQVPPPSSLSIEQLYALFQRAPPVVRSRCEQLALDDQERFNRECVRRRIWEKAMASATNSPAGTPVPSPAPLSVPTTTMPSAQPSTTTTTSTGASSSTQSAVKAPSQSAGSSS